MVRTMVHHGTYSVGNGQRNIAEGVLAVVGALVLTWSRQKAVKDVIIRQPHVAPSAHNETSVRHGLVYGTYWAHAYATTEALDDGREP